jgi:hypothetical protein
MLGVSFPERTRQIPTKGLQIAMKPLRVIQWGTGNVGIEALRGIVESPRLDLAGLRVYSSDKVGRDAGELLERAPIGVVATDSEAEILALDADCVCYTPLMYDLDLLVELLRLGKNVVTTAGLVYPQALGAGVFDRLNEACLAGGTSLHGTGLNPGWIAEVLPLISTGMCRSIRRIHSLEVCDVSDYGSKEMFLGFMKYGQPPEAFENDRRTVERLGDVFKESIALIAAAMDLDVTDIRHEREFVLAERDTDSAVGIIAKGTIAGQKHRFSGWVDDKPVIEVETRWKVVREDLGDGMPDDGECTWTITVEGDPSIRNVVSLAETFQPGSPDRELYSSQRGMVSIAMHALNAIPAVCAAEPGVRTFLDLPIIAGSAARCPA